MLGQAGKMLRILTFVLLVTLSGVLCAEPVNINSATVYELAENLKGIGPKKAQAIVKYREKNGPFFSAEELTNVKGIGPKTIEKNRQDILVR